MNVTVNNSTHQIEDFSMLADLIDQLRIETKGVAIALNYTVITKVDWDKTQLKENDNITIIKATQGG